jgi:hypothetical protein
VGNIRSVKTLPELDLISRPGSDYNDGNVGVLGCFDGFVKTRLIVAPALTSLSVVDGCSVTNGGTDTVERGDTAELTLVDDVVSVLL